MRLVQSLLLASTLGVLLSHCAKGADNQQINPPLPPAEEPSDSLPGAYGPDGGAPRP